MLRACATVLAGALITWILPHRALAEPPARSRVAVVLPATDDRLLREANTRLRAELQQAGFDVIDIERTPGDPRAGVETASQDTQSFATVSIDRAGQGASADVWISDHVTGKTVVRRLRVGGESNAAAVLAIRSMELLRASLLELAAPPRAERSPPAAPADVIDWVEPAITEQARRTEHPFEGPAVSLGVLGLHSFNGVGPALGPAARASIGFTRSLFGRFSYAAPLLAPAVDAAEGQASIDQQFLSLELGFATLAQPLGAYAWAGAGAYHLHTTGAATPPYHSTSAGVFSFLATAGVGGVARVSERVAFSAEVAAFGLVPQPVVVIADREVAKAGAPSVGASLALVVEL